jgi:hypothetical protein
MINLNQAMDIAQRYLREMQKDVGIPMEIIKTREEAFGWIFFYQSKEFLDTGNFNVMLAGNAPFIVNRYQANVHVLGTAHPVDFYVEEYVRQLS